MRNKTRRGEIYLANLPMPSSFFNEFKKRPVLVIQNDDLNEKRDDIILLPISSNLKHSREKSSYIIENFSEVGLKVKSVVICSSIFTIPVELLIRKFGNFSEEKMKIIIEKVIESIS